MNLEEMRRRMKEHLDSFTPEAFCDMLENKYGLKRVEELQAENERLKAENERLKAAYDG